MEEGLNSYGLYLRENDARDRENIDFIIEDKYDNVAFVWGDRPDNVEWECHHPVVEFDDDEPIGECMLCGAKCDCHYEADEGNVEDYAWSGRSLKPHEWYPLEKVGGIVKDILNEMK